MITMFVELIYVLSYNVFLCYKRTLFWYFSTSTWFRNILAGCFAIPPAKWNAILLDTITTITTTTTK